MKQINFCTTEILKRRRGRYTEKQIDMAGKMAGPLTRELDRIFAEQIAEHNVLGSGKQEADYCSDVKKVVSTYQGYRLFDNVPGRKHSAFPDFSYPSQLKDPMKLKKRLTLHLANMDKARGAQKREQS